MEHPSLRTLAAGLAAFLIAPAVVHADPSSTPDPRPYLMAVVGDSISAGFLADTHLVGGTNDASIKPQVEEALSTPSSKAKGFKPKDLLEHQRTLSWFSGWETPSHFVFLQHYLARTEPGAGLVAINAAKFGAEATDALQQTHQILDALATGKYRSLKYVAVMIGVNDMCAGRSDEEISSNLKAIFDLLGSIHQDEPIRVLVVGIGRIPDLGLELIRKNKTFAGMSCGFWYEHVISLCREFTSWKRTEDYENLLKVVDRHNQLIEAQVLRAAKTSRTLLPLFTDLPSQSPVLPQILAKDCFHPNAAGQALLSEKLWGVQPWFH